MLNVSSGCWSVFLSRIDVLSIFLQELLAGKNSVLICKYKYLHYNRKISQNQHRLEVMHFHKPLMRNTRVLERKRHESLGFESDGSGSGTGSSFNDVGGDMSPNRSPQLQSTRAELSFLSATSNGNPSSESMDLPATITTNGIGMGNGACSSSILSAYGNSIFGGL